ncbi:EAL domain-containing protein [Raoultella planticola]|uniref:EAL domain-containing protein n=1 Tax=Raoultella planticola TaxID=575 RepID=UPI00062B763A|nr:EAL domain-containing protein [Raoultella planticola]
MSRKIENVRFPSEMSHHRELSPVCGIRLEMIHFFADSVSNVTEVLSQIQTKLSPDAFFRHLSVQAKQQLFLWQIQQVIALPGRFSLNMSLNMMTQPAFIQTLIAQGRPTRIIIEIQDPGNMQHLARDERQIVLAAIRTLYRAGFKVWLDDLYPHQVPIWQRTGMRFDAIKISSELFHQLRTAEPQLAALIARYREMGERVVIEGVETGQDYALSRDSGADAVQGFLLRDPLPIAHLLS